VGEDGRAVALDMLIEPDAGRRAPCRQAWQANSPPGLRARRAIWDASGSELGRQVAVDFESDADFQECGSFPVHSRLPISSQRCSITRPSSRSTVVVTVRRNVVGPATVGSRCAQSFSASRLTARCSDST
jgi:hypothetical protein